MYVLPPARLPDSHVSIWPFLIGAVAFAVFPGVASSEQQFDLPANVVAVCNAVGAGATCTTVDRQYFAHAQTTLFRPKKLAAQMDSNKVGSVLTRAELRLTTVAIRSESNKR